MILNQMGWGRLLIGSDSAKRGKIIPCGLDHWSSRNARAARVASSGYS